MDASDISTPGMPHPPVRPAKINGRFGDVPERAIDLLELLQVLQRRKNIILACLTLGTVIAATVVFQLTPRYTAESAVILSERKTQVIDVQAVLSGLDNDAAAVRSEVEVLESSPIAEGVVKKLNLTQYPEFNPQLQPASILSPLSDAGHWLTSSIKSLLGAKTAKEGSDSLRGGVAVATRILQSRTEVVNDGTSYVLSIRAQSESPQLAARIADAYADVYLDAQLEAKYDAVKRANDWLNAHLTDLKSQVEASDQAVAAFKAQHNLIQSGSGTDGVTVNAQQLSEINTQLVLASADRAQKESNLQQIQNQLRSGGVDAAAQVLASPLIERLREQETDLLTQEAQLATRYKPEHPAMINIKAQEHDLDQKIKLEIDKIVSSMVGDVAAARAKEQSLRASLQSLQATSSVQDQAEVQLRELQREADSNRTLYENFLNRFKETTAQEDIQQPDARLMAPAAVPSQPSYPRTGVLLALAFGASLLLGIAAAFATERLDNGFRTGEQFEKLAQVVALGVIPDVRASEPAHDAIISHPVSPYSEAIRSTRTALRYSDIDNPPKVVMVTSSLPDEGKSVFSLSFARSIAYSGGRALLIDCDLRRPSIAKLLNMESERSILSLFEPQTNVNDVIHVDEKSGMHFIQSTPGTTNPQDLLGSKQFSSMIEKLRDRYDLIVLDTPPILAVSDALILSHVADTSIFLVRWGRTARPVVLGALKMFRANGGNLAGVVLSRVDFRKHALYGYGDAGYYYGAYGYRRGAYQPYEEA